MADPFATGLRTLHASAIAVEAEYRPAIGDPVPFRVIVDRSSVDAETGRTRVRGRGGLISVPVEVAPSIAVGEVIVIDGEIHRVTEPPELDAEGLSWLAEAPPTGEMV